MHSAMAVNGIALGAIGVGSLFIVSGIKGVSVLATITELVQGKNPLTNAQKINPITGTPLTAGDVGSVIAGGVNALGSGSVNSTDAKTALKQAASTHGWDSGAEWTALDAIEMQEAGYNPTNTNPSSKAYGLAQSLGHSFPGGPAPNGINEYGGNGLSAAQSLAASSGDPRPQAIWMCNYIASRYGDPIKAEQFHLANNWY